MNDEKIVLLYTGEGSSILGVPAMDLTTSMILETGMNVDELILTGLYAKPKTAKPSADSHKADLGGSENK